MFEVSSVYDTMVIGGGPAGVSAALHLSFHSRKVLIVDRLSSPMIFHTNPVNNFPGIKPLSTGVEILDKMRTEVKEYGAVLHVGNVVDITGEYPEFEVQIADVKKGDKIEQTVTVKTVVFATGIARKHPRVKGDWRGWLPYAAKKEISYYCPDCEAPLTFGKDIMIVNSGTVNHALYMAECIEPFARRIRIFMTEDSYRPFNEEYREKLNKSKYEWTKGLIENVIIEQPGVKQKLITSSGEILECNNFFVSWDAVPRSELAVELGAEVDKGGNIVTDHRGKTNVEGVWAAGDVRPITQSVAMAVGTGNYVGIRINNFLRDIGRS